MAFSSCGCGNAGPSADGKPVSRRTTTGETSCASTGVAYKVGYKKAAKQSTKAKARNPGLLIFHPVRLECRFWRQFIARGATLA